MHPEHEEHIHDQDNGSPSSPIKTVPINRDTLLLVSAIVSVIVSIIIAMFVQFALPTANIAEQKTPTVSPNTQTPMASTTEIGLSPNVQPSHTLTQSREYPEPFSTPTLAPAYPEPFDVPTRVGGYPNPGNMPTRVGGYPNPGSTPVQVAAIPEGMPTRTLPEHTKVSATPIPGMPTRSTLLMEELENTPGTIGTSTNSALQPSGQPEPIGTPPSQSPSQLTNTPLATNTPLIEPTNTSRPTNTPQPTDTPPPPPPPTNTPIRETVTPIQEEATMTPTMTSVPLPYVVLSGNIQWNKNQGPIMLDKTVQVAPGSIINVEPGTEVRLGWGVSLVVDTGAQLHALGTPDQPIRFISQDGNRWEGIFGHEKSLIVLDNVDIQQAGASGTVLMSEKGELIIRQSRFTDNGGTILAVDSKLEMRDSQVYGNDFPFGGAVNASYTKGNALTIINNRLGGNRMSEGAPVVKIEYGDSKDSFPSTFQPLVMDVQNNLMLIPDQALQGANLLISTSGPIQGNIVCNGLFGSTDGLNVRSQTPQVPGFRLNVLDNIIDQHIAPVTLYYEQYGIGRGATSEVDINMQNNWWGDPSGPYQPDENPQGRGDSVGKNIQYRPWLQSPPACAPMP